MSRLCAFQTCKDLLQVLFALLYVRLVVLLTRGEVCMALLWEGFLFWIEDVFFFGIFHPLRFWVEVRHIFSLIVTTVLSRLNLRARFFASLWSFCFLVLTRLATLVLGRMIVFLFLDVFIVLLVRDFQYGTWVIVFLTLKGVIAKLQVLVFFCLVLLFHMLNIQVNSKNF